MSWITGACVLLLLLLLHASPKRFTLMPTQLLAITSFKTRIEYIEHEVQVKDHSVIPVTTSLLNQISSCAHRHVEGTNGLDQAYSLPNPASVPLFQHGTMHEAGSAPGLKSTPDMEPLIEQPVHTGQSSELRSPEGGARGNLLPELRVLGKHGFGSMQDLVHMSHVMSVASPYSFQHRNTPQVNSPAPAGSASLRPLATSRNEVPVDHPISEQQVSLHITPRLEPQDHLAKISTAEVKPRALGQPAHCIGPSKRGAGQSMEPTVCGDVTARTWTRGSGTSEIREPQHNGFHDHNPLHGPPPPKVCHYLCIRLFNFACVSDSCKFGVDALWPSELVLYPVY